MHPNQNHHYFTFTRKERIGILSLIVLILIIFILPTFLNRGIGLPDTHAIDQFRAELSALEAHSPKDSVAYDDFGLDKVTNDGKNVASGRTDIHSSPGNKLFDFDPNEISSADWKSLGLRDHTIQTIQRYLSKGGSFKQPSDLQKIYGLQKKDYNRLLPYIRFHKENKQPFTRTYKEGEVAKKTNQPAKENFRLVYEKKTSQILDVNHADSIAFISLQGIGPVLASRIIRFREKLGGFYSIDQIGETYGLADTVFQKIKPFLHVHDDSIKKIDINNADIEQLKIHPYIGWKLANAIVQYRLQHGAFASPGELRELSILNEANLKKILPYLK